MAKVIPTNIDNIKKAILAKQQALDTAINNPATPQGLKIGWTDSSGRYQESGNQIKVSYVAKIHNEGLSNGHGGYHTERRYIEQTKEWLMMNQKENLKAAALFKVNGEASKSLAILRNIAEVGKEYLKSKIQEYNLIDTHRLINSIVIEYTDKDGNTLGG